MSEAEPGTSIYRYVDELPTDAEATAKLRRKLRVEQWTIDILRHVTIIKPGDERSAGMTAGALVDFATAIDDEINKRFP